LGDRVLDGRDLDDTVFYLFFQHRAELEAAGNFTNTCSPGSASVVYGSASLLLDSLSAIYILFITFVAFWIHSSATGYMKGDKGYWRFFAYMNLSCSRC